MARFFFIINEHTQVVRVQHLYQRSKSLRRTDLREIPFVVHGPDYIHNYFSVAALPDVR